MSTSIGSEAETAAVDYLEAHGYEVVERNWRTRVCEIDIVAKKNSVIHFVEVKYRSSARQGGGLEYITPKKLKQMVFAAECWVNEHNYNGDYRLSAIEVSGDFIITQFLDDIS